MKLSQLQSSKLYETNHNLAGMVRDGTLTKDIQSALQKHNENKISFQQKIKLGLKSSS